MKGEVHFYMVFELLGLWIGCCVCLLLSSLDSQRLRPDRRRSKLPRATVRRSRRGAGWPRPWR